MPDWAETEHYALAKPVFGDYVALVRLLNIELKQQRLVDAYQALGGNFRALLFFANAAKGMNLTEEQAFLATLAHHEQVSSVHQAHFMLESRTRFRFILCRRRLWIAPTEVGLYTVS